LRGTMRYWSDNPIIRFSEMNPDSFAERVLSWFDVPRETRLPWSKAASAKVLKELDWVPFSQRVVERLELIHKERSERRV